MEADTDPGSFSVLSGRSAAILDGTDATERTGVVYVEHTQGTERCSGALIDSHTVLTAAHCVFAQGQVVTTPLSPDGFRVGFGEATDQLEYKTVQTVLLPGDDLNQTLAERVSAGLDIAALVLTQDVGTNHETYALNFDFHPTAATAVELTGFGISSTETGSSGRKLSGASQVVGWERDTGVLEAVGKGACLGDSGGPALDDQGRWVGLVSSVATSDNGTPCDGRTFLATVLNAQAAAWLASLTGADGGVPDPVSHPVGPGMEDDPSDTGQDSTAPDSAVTPDEDPPLGSCAVDRRRNAPWMALILLAATTRFARRARSNRKSRSM